MITNLSASCISIFQKSVEDYHGHNDLDREAKNPYPSGTMEHLLYQKNYIDTVQWHMEDVVRDPQILPEMALLLKRRIDRSNQDRTDLVEKIDDYLCEHFSQVTVPAHARLNTESPAWAIDRLSILILKIYHMQEEVRRVDVGEDHIRLCAFKLDILQEQLKDLSISIDELLDDIQAGVKRMKVYRQMKMYNDPSLNPVLYGKQG
ncbi:MAG: DUF4254 domain-containing protein [Bacteroidetes bacterium]|nr:DUF4254 domain-containing protein [Bacteroidota bacterium]